jgi:SAM-dependent methyltransferase
MSIHRAAEPMGEWGLRAARLYGEDRATDYSEFDRIGATDSVFLRLSAWLAALCSGFAKPIAVLDLGCGTGRYFTALGQIGSTGRVRELVGLDASESMLERARLAQPGAGVAGTTLVRGDLETCRFEPGQFDLVYSIGVLAEHAPLTDALARRVFGWLSPGGAFAFTAVHPDSFSIARSWKRRFGRRVMAFAPRAVRQWLRMRWLGGGLYADELRVCDVLTRAGFAVESLDRLVDVHLHCLAVGRKPSGA